MKLSNVFRVGVLPVLGAWIGCNAIIGLELGEPEDAGSSAASATTSATSGSGGAGSAGGATTSATSGGGGAGGVCTTFNSTFVAGSLTNSGFADGQGDVAQFGYVLAMRIDSTTGDVLILDGRIRRMTPGSLVTTIAANVSPVGYANLGVDSVGNVYYLSSTDLHRIQPAGIETVIPVGPLPTVHSFTVGPDDQGYIAYMGGLSRLDLATGATTVLFDGSDLSVPTDLAVDAQGNVLIADVNNQQIKKYDAALGVETLFLANSYALGIALDGAGNVYANGNQFSPTGALLASGYAPGSYGIAVDTAGNVYTALGENTDEWAYSIVVSPPCGP